MPTLNKFFLALAFLGGSAAAQAADSSSELSRMPSSKSDERIDRFEGRSLSTTRSVWSAGFTVQGGDPLYRPLAYGPVSTTWNGVPVTRQTSRL